MAAAIAVDELILLAVIDLNAANKLLEMRIPDLSARLRYIRQLEAEEYFRVAHCHTSSDDGPPHALDATPPLIGLGERGLMRYRNLM